jgi:molybdenum cofactor cytidylyltransferase
MGRSKALLPCGPAGRTFVGTLIGTLREGGVSDVIVVIRSGDAELEREVERHAPAARPVQNPRADEGQLSSLLAGLNAADHPGVHAVLVTPVDAPLVRPDTVAALFRAFAGGAAIVRPAHGGRHGHPVIFGRAVFDELRRADPSVGAKAVVRADPARVRNVDVDDPGVLADIDTPQEFHRHFNEGK